MSKHHSIKETEGSSSMESSTKAIVFASKSVSAESIQGMLQQVARSDEITQVEFRELVLSHHINLLPQVKALACCRRFQRFCFEDSFKIEDYEVWQELRDDMMQDYERASYEHQSHFMESVSWRANIQIPKGTPVQSILSLLEYIQEDLDVNAVSFSGALASSILPFIPQELCGLVDSNSWRLKEDIGIHVTCGWGDEDDWLQLLEDCTCYLSEFVSKRKSRGGKDPLQIDALTESTQSCSGPDKSFPDCLDFHSSSLGRPGYGCDDEDNEEEKENSFSSLSGSSCRSCESCAGYASFYEASYASLASFGNKSTASMPSGVELDGAGGGTGTEHIADASQVMPKAA